MGFLNSMTINILEKSLNASTLRHNVISNNIANVDTPGFKRSEVSFEETLRQQLGHSEVKRLEGYRTNSRHFNIGGPPLTSIQAEIHMDEATIMNNNENNVDIDYEMVLLAKNQLRYNMLIQQMNAQFKELRTAIGRG